MKIETSYVTMQRTDEELKTILISAQTPHRALLFAAGRGGNPDRHMPLLEYLAGLGCLVIAPQMPMLKTPFPTEIELQRRLRSLTLAAHEYADPALPIVGLGHSIGATTLLGLAGGKIWLSDRQLVENNDSVPLERLLLLAPAGDFFQAPGAVDSIQVPIRIWVGALDQITTPVSVGRLASALEQNASVNVTELPEAGHFSFMNELPPTIEDTLTDRDSFLQRLMESIGRNLEGAALGE